MKTFSEEVFTAIKEARRNGAMFEEIEVWVDDSYKDELPTATAFNIVFKPMLPKDHVRVLNFHGKSFRQGVKG
jgi:hypothetical protein